MSLPDKLFINLKIIAKIQKNGRISRSSDGIISLEDNNFYQSIKRFVTSDSRKQSIFEINSIVNETLDCLINIVNSKFMNKTYSNTDEYYKNYESITLIVKEISKSKIGIENLKFTYTKDANITSQLDILIIKINSSIKDMNYKLAYFESLLPKIYQSEIITERNLLPNYYINSTNNTNNINTDSINDENIDIIIDKNYVNDNDDNDNNDDNDDNIINMENF